MMDVLVAERILYNSESHLVQAKARTSEHLITVYKSLGDGRKPIQTKDYNKGNISAMHAASHHLLVNRI